MTRYFMGQALDVHRLQFAFTITFHYIFPQLTMGLALLLVYLKTKALRTGDEHYNRAARFWARVFGVNFCLGGLTGLPVEIQFGADLAAVSEGRGRSDRADAGDGRRVLVFSRIELPGFVLVRRKKARTNRALGGGVFGFSGLLALGLSDRCDGRMDAAPDRLPD